MIGAPVLVVGGDIASIVMRQARTDRLLGEPSQVVWGAGESALRVEVTESEDGEKLTYRVRVLDASGRAREERSLTVDRDMWGCARCRPMTMPTWRWRRGARTSETGPSFSTTPESRSAFAPSARRGAEAKTLAGDWHQAHQLDPLGIVFLVFLSFLYYVAIAAVWLVVWAVRRARGRAQPPSGPGAGADISL